MHVWFLDTVHPTLQERLEGAGMTCHDGTSMTTEALIEQAHSGSPPVQGIVIRSRLTLDQALLSQLPQLEWIARSGSGLENIDTAWCQVHGILVHSSPEGNRDAVGEHTTGMLGREQPMFLRYAISFSSAPMYSKEMRVGAERQSPLFIIPL